MPQEKFSVKLITFLSAFDGFTGYGLIIGILFICGLGVPIPEDITLIAAGILAALGNISFTGALIAGFVGVLLGDTLLFFLGRFYGYRVFKLPVFRRIFTEERIRIAKMRVLSNSKFICFTARFLPGLRAPIFLTAGILGVRPVVFIALDGVAALISVPIWVWLGWYVGDNLDQALEIAGRAQKAVIAGVIFLIVGYFLFNRYNRSRQKDRIDDSADLPAIDETSVPPDDQDSIAPGKADVQHRPSTSD